MGKPDLSRYEQHAAREHEDLCRGAAALMRMHPGQCRVRKCRRDLYCSGPMRPAACQDSVVQARRMLGLSGDAVSRLPLCLAVSPTAQKLFPEFFRLAKRFSDEDRQSGPRHLRRWLKIVLRLKSLQPPACETGGCERVRRS